MGKRLNIVKTGMALLVVAGFLALAVLAASVGGVASAMAIGLGVPVLLGVLFLMGASWTRSRRAVGDSSGAGRTLQDLDRMDGRQFEAWIAATLRSHGFAVHDTPHVGDFGVDVLCTPPGGAGRVAIQAKRYKGNVGNKAVQEAIAGGQFHDCIRAAVVTQSRFTPAAKRQAERADPPVILIDRRRLGQLADILVAVSSRAS